MVFPACLLWIQPIQGRQKKNSLSARGNVKLALLPAVFLACLLLDSTLTMYDTSTKYLHLCQRQTRTQCPLWHCMQCTLVTNSLSRLPPLTLQAAVRAKPNLQGTLTFNSMTTVYAPVQALDTHAVPTVAFCLQYTRTTVNAPVEAPNTPAVPPVALPAMQPPAAISDAASRSHCGLLLASAA